MRDIFPRITDYVKIPELPADLGRKIRKVHREFSAARVYRRSVCDEIAGRIGRDYRIVKDEIVISRKVCAARVDRGPVVAGKSCAEVIDPGAQMIRKVVLDFKRDVGGLRFLAGRYDCLHFEVRVLVQPQEVGLESFDIQNFIFFLYENIFR